MTRIASLLGVWTVLASLVMGAESDWPNWRGPNCDGKSNDMGLLKQWPSDGPKLLWKVDGIGVGFSSVAVVAGKVYISGDQDGKLKIFAFDLEGKPLWNVEHGEGRGGPDGARSSPVIDRGNLYLVNGDGLIGCFDAETGEKKWSRDGQGVRRLAGRLGLCRVGADPQEPGDLQARRQELHRRPRQDHRRDGLEEHRLRRRAGVRLVPRRDFRRADDDRHRHQSRASSPSMPTTGKLLWSNDWSRPATRPTARRPPTPTATSSGPTATARAASA